MDSSRDLLDLEIKPEFLALAGGFFPLSHLGSLKSISKYTNQYNGYECNSAAVLKSSTKVFMKVKVNVAQSCPPQLCPTLSTPWTYSPWNSPGQNTGVGSLSLLQGIFQTQGLSPCLPNCRRIGYQLSHKEIQESCSE